MISVTGSRIGSTIGSTTGSVTSVITSTIGSTTGSVTSVITSTIGSTTGSVTSVITSTIGSTTGSVIPPTTSSTISVTGSVIPPMPSVMPPTMSVTGSVTGDKSRSGKEPTKEAMSSNVESRFNRLSNCGLAPTLIVPNRSVSTVETSPASSKILKPKSLLGRPFCAANWFWTSPLRLSNTGSKVVFSKLI